jgi:antitoxin (DNA-binding transcriptional repressor) of toxin-antitoxin stability system
MGLVSRGALRARVLEYFRRVEESGETLMVTSHRRPVPRTEPIRERGSWLRSCGVPRSSRVTLGSGLTPGLFSGDAGVWARDGVTP